MTYFRVDDRFHSHPKLARLGEDARAKRTAKLEALGLWVIAGSWASAHLTDGFVPRAFVLAHACQRVADALVHAGLWEVSVDGPPGYRFHDWRADNRFTREDAEAIRRKNAERKAKERSRKRESRGQSQRDSGVTAPVRHDVTVTPLTQLVTQEPEPEPEPEPLLLLPQQKKSRDAAALLGEGGVVELTLHQHEQEAAMQPGRAFMRRLQRANVAAYQHNYEHWRRSWDWMGNRPEEEQGVVVEVLKRSVWCREHWRQCTPKHLVQQWHTYAAGQEPGQSASPRRGAAPVSSREEFAREQEDQPAWLTDEGAMKGAKP